jgi:murein DD-endopeptidase MepM/ murein hydrolase activator NlpD
MHKVSNYLKQNLSRTFEIFSQSKILLHDRLPLILFVCVLLFSLALVNYQYNNNSTNPNINGKNTNNEIITGYDAYRQASTGSTITFTTTNPPTANSCLSCPLAVPTTLTRTHCNANGHRGIDLVSASGQTIGTPVYSSATGNIVFAGWQRDSGYAVVVSFDNNGVETRISYQHLAPQIRVARGDKVTAGQVIGNIGEMYVQLPSANSPCLNYNASGLCQNGNMTGPHLHMDLRISPFEWNKSCSDSQFIDPLTLLPASCGGTCVGNPFPPVPGECTKLGINFAVNGAISDQSITRGKGDNMGFGLFIAIAKDQEGQLVSSMNKALENNITPILRICYDSDDPNHCNDFKNPVDYIAFINRISNQLNGNIYVIAGPNEPLTETWLGNNEGDPVSTAQKVAPYMNRISAEFKNSAKVKVLSPAFNSTNHNFPQLITQMRFNGAKFDDLDGIAINAYNTRNETISDFVTITKNVGFTNKDIFITEIGMYDKKEGVPEQTALDRLKTEIEKLRQDSQIKAMLLFNSYGDNKDDDFKYNVMTQTQVNYVNGEQCANQEKPVCRPQAPYCNQSIIDGSFERFELVQQSDSVLVPTGTHAWWQNNTSMASYQCGDYQQTPQDIPDSVCRKPEFIVSKAGGGQMCQEKLSSHGDYYLKIFSAQGSMNGGLCFSIPSGFIGGSAGFDVKVKQDKNPAYGEVKVFLGHSTLEYNQVNESNWQQVNWGTPQVIGSGDYTEFSRFKTTTITANIPAGAKSLCIRANNEMPYVGIDTFWDGGFLIPYNASCSTALDSFENDGIDRTGGGDCRCDEETGGSFSVQDPQLFDWSFEPPNRVKLPWHGSACENDKESNNPRHTPEDGVLSMDMNFKPCKDVNNPYFTCADQDNNWTAGYVWTACMKEFPLLGYLSSDRPTEDNNFTTPCEFLMYRNFSPEGPINSMIATINPGNRFPGLTKWVTEDREIEANLRVPLLGGAAACGYINYDDHRSPLVVDPYLVGEFDDTAGYVLPIKREPTIMAQALNIIKQVFVKSSISNDNDSNEIRLDEPKCTELPGGPIIKLNVSDTILYDFADDGGACESIIEAGNFDLTRNELCDIQFRPSAVPEILERTGAIKEGNCTLDTIPKVFEWSDFIKKTTFEQAGMLEEYTHVTPGTWPDPDISDQLWIVSCRNRSSFYPFGRISASISEQSSYSGLAQWQSVMCSFFGGPVSPIRPDRAVPWTVVCRNATSYIEDRIGVQAQYVNRDMWANTICAPNGGIAVKDPDTYEQKCRRKAPTYANNNFCGMFPDDDSIVLSDCKRSIFELYDTCRQTNVDVNQITGSPYSIFKTAEAPWENIYIKGLFRMLESAFLTEYISIPLPAIDHENVGIAPKVCTSLYDIQRPTKQILNRNPYEAMLLSGTIGVDGNDRLPFLDPTVDPQYQLIRALQVVSGNKLVQSVTLDPIAYDHPYSGGYSLGNISSREPGVQHATRICFTYYIPYIGQIPRMYERVAFFLTNQGSNNAGVPYSVIASIMDDKKLLEKYASSDMSNSTSGNVAGILDFFPQSLRNLLITINRDKDKCIDEKGLNCDTFTAKNDDPRKTSILGKFNPQREPAPLTTPKVGNSDLIGVTPILSPPGGNNPTPTPGGITIPNETCAVNHEGQQSKSRYLPFAYNFTEFYDKYHQPGSSAGRVCNQMPPAPYTYYSYEDIGMKCEAYSIRVNQPQYEFYRGALKNCSIPINQVGWTTESTFGKGNDIDELYNHLVNNLNVTYKSSRLAAVDSNKVKEVLRKSKNANRNPMITIAIWGTESNFGLFGNKNEWNCFAPGVNDWQSSLDCYLNIGYFNNNTTDQYIDRYGPFCDNETYAVKDNGTCKPYNPPQPPTTPPPGGQLPPSYSGTCQQILDAVKQEPAYNKSPVNLTTVNIVKKSGDWYCTMQSWTVNSPVMTCYNIEPAVCPNCPNKATALFRHELNHANARGLFTSAKLSEFAADAVSGNGGYYQFQRSGSQDWYLATEIVEWISSAHLSPKNIDRQVLIDYLQGSLAARSILVSNNIILDDLVTNICHSYSGSWVAKCAVPRVPPGLGSADCNKNIPEFFDSNQSFVPGNALDLSIKPQEIGKSTLGKPIEVYTFGSGSKDIVLVGGVDGALDLNTSVLAYQMIDYFKNNLDQIPQGSKLHIIPVVNPDALEKYIGKSTELKISDINRRIFTRDLEKNKANSNNVVLSRNFAGASARCPWINDARSRFGNVNAGSQAFSEIETQVLRNYLQSINPEATIWYSNAGGIVEMAGCDNGEIYLRSETLAKAYLQNSYYGLRSNQKTLSHHHKSGDPINWQQIEGMPAIRVMLTNHYDTDFELNIESVKQLLKD